MNLLSPEESWERRLLVHLLICDCDISFTKCHTNAKPLMKFSVKRRCKSMKTAVQADSSKSKRTYRAASKETIGISTYANSGYLHMYLPVYLKLWSLRQFVALFFLHCAIVYGKQTKCPVLLCLYIRFHVCRQFIAVSYSDVWADWPKWIVISLCTQRGMKQSVEVFLW